MYTIPTDSTDARETRELEAERAAAEAEDLRRHQVECHGGWRGEDSDGRPRPCPRCRPHLIHVPCHTCSTPYAACAGQQGRRRGPCCPCCDHHRRSHPEEA